MTDSNGSGSVEVGDIGSGRTKHGASVKTDIVGGTTGIGTATDCINYLLVACTASEGDPVVVVAVVSVVVPADVATVVAEELLKSCLLPPTVTSTILYVPSTTYL